MYLSELIKKDKKEINKISKDKIVEAITNSKWQWESNESKVADAEKRLVEQSKNEDGAKRLMLGYLGESLPKDEYGTEKQLKEVSLLELLGKVLVKASRYE
jgi:hypothetical protein